MFISPISSISFKARKQEIKNADDIQRQARLAFPMISETYIGDYYLSSKGKNKYFAQRIIDKLFESVLQIRRPEYFPDKFGKDLSKEERTTMYAPSLKGIAKEKTGNCEEYSKTVLAVLCANGYYNSERVELAYRSDFINKKTGEIEYSDLSSLDHAFVLTDMNTGNKNIVIDGWLSFADTKENAMAEYKNKYTEGDLKDARKKSIRKFMLIKGLEKNEIEKRYDIKSKIEFNYVDKYVTEYQLKKLGDFARKYYPKTVISREGNT